MGAIPLIRDSSDVRPLNTDLDVPGTTVTLDSDNVGDPADCAVVAEQGSGLNGELRYVAADQCWKLSNAEGPLSPLRAYPGRPTIDSGHIIVWSMDGAAGETEPNDGAGSAITLTAGGSPAPFRGSNGLFPGLACASKDTMNGFWSGTVGSPAVDIPSSFVIEGWFKCDYNAAASYQIFSKNWAYAWNSPYVVANLQISAGRINGAWASGAGSINWIGYARTGGPAIMVSVGEWHHAALRYTPGSPNNTASLFYDGKLVESVTTAAALAKNANAGPWVVGCRYNGSLSVESLMGEVSDFRVTDQSVVARLDSYFDSVYHAGRG